MHILLLVVAALACPPFDDIVCAGEGACSHVAVQSKILFREENVMLLLPAGQEDIRERAITERLFRRIIARLYTSGILDATKSIVNTGSWIGDNAVPWAMMLTAIARKRGLRPGKVYAVDPSKANIERTYDLAHAVGANNVCVMQKVFDKGAGAVSIPTKSLNHASIGAKPGRWFFLRKPKTTLVQTMAIDALNLTDIGLLHIDVEGYEEYVLRGARTLLQTTRPIVVTESYAYTTKPVTTSDKRVKQVMRRYGYHYSDEIPEVCGANKACRNRIWWPDAALQLAAHGKIGALLNRSLVSWISPTLT